MYLFPDNSKYICNSLDRFLYFYKMQENFEILCRSWSYIIYYLVLLLSAPPDHATASPLFFFFAESDCALGMCTSQPKPFQ